MELQEFDKLEATQQKYKLPHHWIRDPLGRYGVLYFAYVNLVLQLLPKHASKILDAGCGSGRAAAEIIGQGHEVTGIDYLDTNIGYARIFVPKGNFVQGDLRVDLITQLGLSPDYFDVAVLVEVFEHIPPGDASKVLANLHRVLRPGGQLIISVPSKHVPVTELHYRHFNLDEINEELTASDFTILRTIKQHKLSSTVRRVMSKKADEILFNSWIQPTFLSRLRRKWFMKFANVASDDSKCGRYILVAQK